VLLPGYRRPAVVATQTALNQHAERAYRLLPIAPLVKQQLDREYLMRRRQRIDLQPQRVTLAPMSAEFERQTCLIVSVAYGAAAALNKLYRDPPLTRLHIPS
jgi:hypothetical protein